VGFDLMMETLRVTNLGELKPGDEVNLERAARFGDEIGGHLLSGHIHGRARLLQRETPENNLRLLLEAPAGLERYLLPKGYVALDGVSLTLGEVDGRRFSVYLIPETLRVTTLGQRSPGELLNLEIDTQTQAVVDTVERVLAERRGDDDG
jgi:riboflavin synthase